MTIAVNALAEHDLQRSIIDECNWRANQDARWGLIFCVPNGQYRKGQRMEAGLKAGVPDLFLPVPRAATKAHPVYHGMFIELKIGRNVPTGEQERWLRLLREQGYYTCWIHDEPSGAIDLLKWYLYGEI